MTANLEELTTIKESYEKKKVLVERLRGRRQVALEQLKKEFGINNPKAGEKECRQYQKRLEVLDEKFYECLKRFQKEYPQLNEEEEE